MERLATDSMRLTLVGILLAMLTTLFSNPLSAKVKGPDFTQLTSYELDFSGAKVGFELPGGLDKRFPPLKDTYSANIYDNESYHNLYFDSRFLKRNWDYRGYFWQGVAGRFGGLGLRVTLIKTSVPNASSLRNDLPALRNAITEHTEGYYQRTSEFKGMKVEYQLDMAEHRIQDLSLLRVKERNSDERKTKRIIYYIPLTDEHYIGFDFSLLTYGDEPFEKWEKYAMEDIEKIMQTLSIQYPPSM
jgi:hypothetical protein